MNHKNNCPYCNMSFIREPRHDVGACRVRQHDERMKIGMTPPPPETDEETREILTTGAILPAGSGSSEG